MPRNPWPPFERKRLQSAVRGFLSHYMPCYPSCKVPSKAFGVTAGTSPSASDNPDWKLR